MRALLAFAVAVLVFHHLPALAGRFGDWIDLVTPFAVLAAAAAVVPSSGRRAGSGRSHSWRGSPTPTGTGSTWRRTPSADGLTGEAEDTAYFWDERFGHIEWHAGLLGLRSRSRSPSSSGGERPTPTGSPPRS